MVTVVKSRTQRRMKLLRRTSICLAVLCLAGVGAQDCHVERLNGTATFHINETVPVSEEYSWRVNDDVHANEDHYNRTTVLSRGPRHITFKNCYENVTYMNAHNGKTIKCPHDECSINPSLERHSAKNNGFVAGVAVAVVVSVLAAGALCSFLWWKRNKLQQWAHDMRDTWCGRQYSQARQDP